ncbi:MAG: hypothetical protein JXQ23_03770 [Clostridia bacterium]|nr:hypothetical protein [Clostridia bacterium]
MDNSKTQKFMFFDDWPFEYRRGFERKQGYPVKYAGNPIVKPELPHEFGRTSLYGTILYDEELKLFKMWYPTFSGLKGPTVSYLCYAESEDGISWIKPDLDVVKGTNIVLDKEHQVRGQTIIYDKKEADPERRYKLLVRPGHIPYTCSYVSPDGIHWKMLDSQAINGNSDSHIGLIRHPETDQYMATMRKIKGDRRVWLSTSNDFEHWTDPVLVKELPVEQSMQTQIYGMQISYYGAYILGCVSYYNTFEDDLEGWGKMDGTMDIGLAYSRGGYCWHEDFVNDRFIKLGEEGSWDCGMISPSSHPILLEDKILYYYAGMPYHHKPPYNERDLQCIGMAVLRPDGFCYIEAKESQAELLTRNFYIDEYGFEMNADAANGEISVEVCDSDGNAIEGFEFENFHKIKTDSCHHVLSWDNSPDTSVLLLRAIRFKIKAVNAKIYSVTMINGEENPRYWKFKEIHYADPLFDKNIKDA